MVLLLAAALRLVTFAQIRGSALLYLHHWSETDMYFYHTWAQAVAAGDVLTDRSMKPYHSWHMHVARTLLAEAGEPYSEAAGRQVWDRLLGEKVFYQDPLYPYLLGAIYALAGPEVRAVVVVQALLGLGCVALVFGLARRLFDPEVALLAGLAAALFGPLVFYETQLLRSVLNAFLGLASLDAAIRALERPGWLVPAGLLSGLAFLGQSSTLPFAAWVGLVLLGRLGARPLGRFVLGFALAASPLVARNAAVGVFPLSLASTGGVTFLNHNTPEYEPAGGDALSAHAADILGRTAGRFGPIVLETLRTHPDAASFVRLLGSKLAAFFWWYEVPNNGNYYYFCLFATGLGTLGVGFAWIGPLGAVGLGLALRRSAGCALAAASIACGIAVSVIFYHLARFRLPIACAMIPFAAYTAAALVRRLREGRWLQAALAAVPAAALAAVVLRPLPLNPSGIWLADYGVGNEIVLNLARRAQAAGDLAGAAELIERQLRTTEPADLRELRPGLAASRLAVVSAQAAGSFAPLHELCAALHQALRRPALAQEHLQRAQVLRIIATQFEQHQKAATEAKP